MQKIILPLAFLTALIAGFLLGRALAPTNGPSAQIDSGPSQSDIGTQIEERRTTEHDANIPPSSNQGMEQTADSLTMEQKLAEIDTLKLTASLKNSIRTLELIASMSENELQGMLQEMGQRGMGSISDWMMPYYVFTAWVEKNPQNAYKFLEDEANPMQQQMYSHSLFSAWAATDPDGALAAVEQISDKQKREQAFGAVAMAIAGKDPNRAYNLLASREDTSSWQYQTVFMLWAGQDMDAAMAKIETMETGQERTHALSGVISGMATKNIDRAAEFAMSLERDNERQQALQGIMYNWIQQDFDGALEFLSQLEPGESKNNIIQNSIWAMASSDPEKALVFARSQMSGQAQDNAVSNIIGQMARKDPEKAVELVATLPYGRVYSSSIRNIANQWGSEDPMAALTWAKGLGDGEEKDQAMSSILSSFAQNKPDEAKLYLNQMPEGNDRVNLAANIAQKMASSDPKGALLWAGTLTDEKSNQRATESAISAWAAQKPKEVVAYLQATGGEDQVIKHARVIADNWARTDVESAAQWALGLEGEARKEAVDRVSHEWLQHNTEEASVWISELDAGPARDDAVRNLVNKVYRSDPAAAFAWATTMGNENERSSYTRRAVNELKSEGKSDQARQMIRSSSLDDSEKEKLLKRLED